MYLLLRMLYRKLYSAARCGQIHRFSIQNVDGRWIELDSCADCGMLKDNPWKFYD